LAAQKKQTPQKRVLFLRAVAKALRLLPSDSSVERYREKVEKILRKTAQGLTCGSVEFHAAAF